VEEGYTGRWPDEIKMDEATKRRVDKIWQQLKLVKEAKKQ
jgi:3-polyprenyl-4-hydroxybenzoate decarboxylase